jgi:phosphoribosylformylglycinamidine cyclo-ligase
VSARPLTYRDAGVDIGAADRLVGRIRRLAESTRGPEVLSGVGLFAAAVRVPRGLKEPVMMVAADGVGTKLAVARLAGKHDTIGIDLVAMNVNDILTTGARPLCFLDYLSVGRLASVDAEAIIAGVAEGCRRAGASLVGGETAEMPGFYKNGDYDLAGFSVGVVERRKIIDGSKIRPGNAIIGLPSSGLHSNGYSLARKALGIGTRATGARLARLASTHAALAPDPAAALLEPTTIYVKPVLAALAGFSVKGMAHVTGGGIPGNLVRILPQGVAARIERSNLPRLEIFDAIESAGRVRRADMDSTFNCGIGFILVVGRRDADSLCSFMRRRSIDARIIGHIERGRRTVTYTDGG